MYKRNCPLCGKELIYKNKDGYRDAVKTNRRCRSCANKNRPPLTIEQRNKISQRWKEYFKTHDTFGKGKTKETSDKIKNRSIKAGQTLHNKYKNNELIQWNKGKTWDEIYSKEVQQKIKLTCWKKGDRPKNADFRKGKTLEEIYGLEKSIVLRKKMSNRMLNESIEARRYRISQTLSSPKFWIAIHSNKRKEKFQEKMLGRKQTLQHRLNLSKVRKGLLCGDRNPSKRPEVRQKLRIYTVNRLFNINKNFHPGYNKYACELFDLISKQNNTYIQHAMNGGEYYIKELGYWVDGYDKENNTVYEYYEKWHYDLYDKLRERDNRRREEIKKHLNCKFIEIKYDENIRL